MARKNSQNDDAEHIFALIEKVSVSFRDGWRQGDRPQIETLLDRVPDGAKETLLRRLLPIEIRYRRRANEAISIEDYLLRFPNYRVVVGDTFHESTSGIGVENLKPVDHDSKELPVTHALDQSIRLGKYELVRELGRGGFGIVYEASHVEQQHRVALKVLPMNLRGRDLNVDHLHRFRREFRSLSDINHPNLVGMQTFEVEGDRWFFTMDLIHGIDFLSYVRPDGELDERRLRKSLSQVVAGITALHQRGIVHRDLKPSNILVEREGRVAVLDFGLVADLQLVGDQTASLKSMAFAGTPRYAAPEQLFGERSEASDWYALGVILFEALTGSPPFEGNDFSVLKLKQNESPPNLCDRKDLPSDLTDLTDRLLKRNPAERISTSQIIEHAGVEFPSSTHATSFDAEELDVSQSLDVEVELIGRDQQIESLVNAHRRVQEDRHPVVVFVTGRSGEGKSALVEHFIRPVRRTRECLVFSGRCYDRESVPFNVIDGQIEALVRHLRAQDQDRIDKLLPDDVRILAHVFPMLRRVEAIERQAKRSLMGIDDRQLRRLAFAALKDLLRAISQETVIVMFVDDLQWGDADSAEALAQLLVPPDPPAVLFLGTYRSDEQSTSGFLNQWAQLLKSTISDVDAREVAVEPLTQEQCFALYRSRRHVTETPSEELVRSLYQCSKGNAYFLEQLIENQIDNTDTFQPVPVPTLIQSRLSKCPEGAAELLDVIAVANKATAISEIAQVAERQSSAFSTLTHMRTERLVRFVGSRDERLVDTYHDQIREAVLLNLSDEERRRIHRRIGNIIELSVGSQVDESINNDHSASGRAFDIAYHYYHAHDPRAFAFQLEAGELAYDTYAMENAVDHLRRAEEIRPTELKKDIEFRLRFTLAESLLATRRFEEARKNYRAAIESSSNSSQEAKCYYGIGRSEWGEGDIATASTSLENAIRAVGEPVARSVNGHVLQSIVSFCQYHSPLKIPRIRQRAIDVSSAELLSEVVQLYSVTQFQNVFAVTSAFARNTSNTRYSKHLPSNALAIANYAWAMSQLGFVRIGRRAARRAERMMNQHDIGSIKPFVQQHLGACYYTLGNLDHAEALLKDTLPELQRTRNFMLSQTYHWLRHVASIRGETKDIVKWATLEREVGDEQNGKIVAAYGNYGLADGYSRMGQTKRGIEFGHAAVEQMEESNAFIVIVAMLELGRAQIQDSDYEAANQTLSRATKRIFEFLFLVELIRDVFALRGEALLGADWHLVAKTGRELDFRTIKRVVRLSRGFTRPYPTLRAHAFRISGRYEAACGRPRQAIRYFERAIAAAEKIGATYEHARALIDKSMIDPIRFEADRQKGLAMLDELGGVLPAAERAYV